MHYHGWHLACQTYALNLIDSHSGQNRAPQLFSSPKSFRVAKSALLSVFLPTAPSATSSAGLSSISKWLSKPLLLFKSSLLFKSALFFAPLLLLSYTQAVQALSAYTSMAIEGSAPYFTFDGGQTKLTDTDSLLTIKLQDGTEYTKSTNPSTPTNPIRLLNVGDNLSHIDMIVPPSQSSITMNDLVSQGNWKDDDGDGQVTASGSISVAFRDKNGNTVNRSDALSICSAPYKVTLTSTGGTLSTQYGVPRSSSFSGATVDYYINPNSSVNSCYFVQSVRPNLLLGGTTGIVSYDSPRHAGPANIWNPKRGFLVQSTSPSSYDRNFPTTGADGLYFDLEIPTGIDGSQLSWTVNTSGSISTTVSWTRPRSGTFTDPKGNTVQADEWISDKSKNVARVTLHGPKADSTQISLSNPSPLTRPSLPQTFELVGRDSNGNEVRYGFVLRQWFVNRSSKRDTAPNQTAWCNSLGYRLPRVSDLTNAKCGVDRYFPCVNGIDGATPSSLGNYYMRHIGAGFFTEWGAMYHYADAGFSTGAYKNWSSNATGSDQFRIDPYNGDVDSKRSSNSNFAVCTTP
ncbi:hypothetical protein [Gilliamella sp. Pas-s27]|uniref:hypothetical protein n=1 Tax=Gilliamella sp. Pas-s27 TaxID=2687311 RepID=UPI0013662B48|nr:hypothetical protein [Gilliamella sp. Pas-s27]MWP46316.1 hypothetical protein [Gilliamella sp. Pas-s27]